MFVSSLHSPGRCSCVRYVALGLANDVGRRRCTEHDAMLCVGYRVAGVDCAGTGLDVEKVESGITITVRAGRRGARGKGKVRGKGESGTFLYAARIRYVRRINFRILGYSGPVSPSFCFQSSESRSSLVEPVFIRFTTHKQKTGSYIFHLNVHIASSVGFAHKRMFLLIDFNRI